MRIRKRSILPLFSISPPPQTAPDLPRQENDERLEKEQTAREKQQQQQEDQETEEKERRSGFDPTTHHSKDRSDGWFPPDEMMNRCCMLSTPIPKQVVETMKVKGEEGEEDEDEKRWSARDMSSKRNGSMNCGNAETGASLSSSSLAFGKWEEGESAYPFKKRKASYQLAKETIIRKEKKMKSKLKKTKTSNKIDDEEEVKEEVIGDDTSSVTKWGSNCSVVMEGSRCSRVNGRGWRCCQQTLVGYSLCEHHLGKGRLRSLSSVQSRDENDDEGLLSSPSKTIHEENNIVVDDEKEEQKLASLVMNKKKKKKKKIGMVKARSISSLLGQTHHATTATLLASNATV